MSKQKVLYICHNHPAVMPGGAEVYAHELYEAMRGSERFEPVFLARIGSTVATQRTNHPGTLFSAVNGDPNQYFFFSETDHFDFFLMTSRDKDMYTRHYRDFLLAHRPDVVHFQHTLFLGFDLIHETRQTLPDAVIVYTLHEYLPICHHHGQMVQTHNNEPCLESSPRRCHECFPDISPQAFFLRKRFIQSHLSLVDRFIAPSHFLMERFVDWGIPRGKIVYEEYGRSAANPSANGNSEHPRTRLGYFGQLNSFKGINVLLRAMKLLSGSATGVHLWVHGANLEIQSPEFQREFNDLVKNRENVTIIGRYNREDLAGLIAKIDWVVVPSIWWENSPLVIQEAFQYGRPVICSGMGSMAEKVTDNVDGLHFRAGDPMSLASTIQRTVQTPDLWKKLHDGIKPTHTMRDHMNFLAGLYDSLQTRAS